MAKEHATHVKAIRREHKHRMKMVVHGSSLKHLPAKGILKLARPGKARV